MANHNPNGRNVMRPDENRPSWRPQDQEASASTQRSRLDDDERRMQRGDSDRFGGGSRMGSNWEEDRDEGYRGTEHYGQGQSGYGGGRIEGDRSWGTRNQSIEGRGHVDNQDERWSGRGGQGYYERGRGEDRGRMGHRNMGGDFDSDFGDYNSGYHQGAMGYGGYGMSGPQQGAQGYRGGSGGAQMYRDESQGRYGGQDRGMTDGRWGAPQNQYGGGSYGGGGMGSSYGGMTSGTGQGGYDVQRGRDIDRGYGSDIDRGYGMQRDIDRGYGMQRDVDRGYGMQRDIDRGYGMQRDIDRYGMQRGRDLEMQRNRGLQDSYGMQGGYGGGMRSMYPGGMEPRGLGHRGKGPQGWQRSDERIKDLVSELLHDDDDIDASRIQVDVKSGEVTLSGSVPDRYMKRAAEDLIERASGVKDVQNNLRVQGEMTRGNNGHPTNPTTSSGVSKTEADDKKPRA